MRRPSASVSSAAAGFTLTELLVVLALIVVLLALVTPRLLSAKARADEKLCHAQAALITQAIVEYRLDHGEDPGQTIGDVLNKLQVSENGRAVYLDDTVKETCDGGVFTLTSEGGAPKVIWQRTGENQR
ncbi:prepilin-type N-terminal cleavage/methylation domain-containing protein [Hydrogenibacillus sp. N12]|uniref:prepilin-type N-terminal cleavage/methylation domain-containing protein n=1 Tax=Hydrogenibacillus sp. N12 TaxID=2866627 RepID=UPI001C7CDFD6|nr:prepilin-type N-terminal cleavage/methylation domain-containing protein [Hydrogenibacillus sp. N12]QZA33378.1 prepilin-type N-terminal cleavage/methylation domain-containing protein [Hydrogenibacillus sp. N12]